MKRILGILIFAFTFATVNAQTTGFVAPSASYSTKTMSYSLEAGLCVKKTWLSASYTFTPSSEQSVVGLNLYNRLLKDENLSVYTYNSAKLNVNTSTLYYEPGLSLVYDVNKRLSPQFTATVPIVKNTNLSYTLSLMYNFN